VSGCCPEKMMVATPNAFDVNFGDRRRVDVGGSSPRALFTTRCTSTDTRSGLAAVVNCTITVDTPDEEIDVKSVGVDVRQ